MPFGPYDDFADCVAQNADKDDPAAYCAVIQEQAKASVERSSWEIADEDEMVAPAMAIGPAWEGVLALEDEMTGDGRIFAPGAVRWETLPIPLRWTRHDVGEHQGAVVVGRIDEVYRDGNRIMGRGVFDDWSEDAAEAAHLVEAEMSPGISVDMDDVSFEIRMDDDQWPDGVMVTTDARLRAATLVATPAFADARIRLVAGTDRMGSDEDEETYALSGEERTPTSGMAEDARRALDWRAEGHSGGEENTVQRARSIAAREALSAETIRRMHAFFSRNAQYPTMNGFSPGDDGFPSPARVAWGLWGGDSGATWARTLVERMDRQDATVTDDDAMTASSIPSRPPATWFRDPSLAAPTPLTVTDDGRVYGHLATWGTCHTGFVGDCVQPPSSATGYAYFRTGSVRTVDGQEVPTGRITLDTTHAGRRLGASDTASHYEHTGVAVADVAAGEDAYGIWVAGSLRPGVTDEQVRVLQASPLSGDWRRIGGNLELVAALAVNSPGFPIPRVLVAGGSVQTLQASGVLKEDGMERLHGDHDQATHAHGSGSKGVENRAGAVASQAQELSQLGGQVGDSEVRAEISNAVDEAERAVEDAQESAREAEEAYAAGDDEAGDRAVREGHAALARAEEIVSGVQEGVEEFIRNPTAEAAMRRIVRREQAAMRRERREADRARLRLKAATAAARMERVARGR